MILTQKNIHACTISSIYLGLFCVCLAVFFSTFNFFLFLILLLFLTVLSVKFLDYFFSFPFFVSTVIFMFRMNLNIHIWYLYAEIYSKHVFENAFQNATVQW